VITREPLDNYLPVQFAPQGEQTIISQYSLHPIEDLGLLKMDFLGLKNLTIVEHTLYRVEKTEGIKLDIDKIPLDDKKTYELLLDGRTTGVFQLESSGMRRYLRQLKPTELEDIIAMVSLYRPGPMNWIPDYISGKHKTKETKYLHPLLKPILERTHGVVIYQEQVMQIARDLAGFTLGEADVLRKAVGKKIPKLLKEQRNKFITGCVANKIAKETAEKIFDFIEPFAGYGFNRAHAACYAQIAYQTAYLKANYPKAFMASLLTSDQDDIDRVAIEVEECRQMGIRVLPPDINESFSTFTVVVDPKTKKIFNHLRFGLLAIKNVGENISKTIISERRANGPYKNLEDFLRRVQTKDLNKKSLESLTKSGALDKFGEMGEMMANIDQLLLYSKGVEKEIENHQTNLFGQLPMQNAPGLRLKKVEPTSKKQKLAWEKELLGLYISAHPLEDYHHYLKNVTIPCREVANHLSDGRIRIGGIITQIQRVITRNNEPMLFVKVEDMSAAIEVLVFPNVLKTNPIVWQEDKIVLIEGKFTDKDGVVKLICDEAREFDKDKIKNNLNKQNNDSQTAKITKIIYINLDKQKANQEVFDQLKTIMAKYPGKYKVYLKINQINTASKLIATNFYMNHNEEVKDKIEKITGQNSVIFK
jgi:DNA polymerase-3 subunit alpha